MNQLDEAQLKAEMRALYRDHGVLQALSCMYELLLSAKFMAEIIQEENEKT